MIRTTSLFWDCKCKDNFFHRQHEEECVHCGAQRDDHPSHGSTIAELLQCHSEFLTPDEISAFERALKPVLNEIWFLVVADGVIDIRDVSPSMLTIEEAYVRRAEEVGAPWDEARLDYDWSCMDETCAVYGINTTTVELV